MVLKLLIKLQESGNKIIQKHLVGPPRKEINFLSNQMSHMLEKSLGSVVVERPPMVQEVPGLIPGV